MIVLLVFDVQLTSGFNNFRISISKTFDFGISAMKKVSSNYQVRPALSLIPQSVMTILYDLICYVMIVAKPYKVFHILKRTIVKYPQEITLASLSELIKAENLSLPLFRLKL